MRFVIKASKRGNKPERASFKLKAPPLTFNLPLPCFEQLIQSKGRATSHTAHDDTNDSSGIGAGNDDTTSEVNSLFQLNEKMRARV